MCDSILTEEDYQKILNQKFGKDSVKFIKATLKPLSENVEGFMGEHYTLQITYDQFGEERVDHFFVKTKPRKNIAQRQVTEKENVFQVEVFLYAELFSEYEKYGLDISFSPKCWYAVGEETMVMTDMVRQGYTLAERGKWYGMDKSKCALKSLAQLHATGIIYEEKKSKELQKEFSLEKEYPDIFRERFFTYFTEYRSVQGEEWLKLSIDIFCKMIDELDESIEYKEEFKKTLREREIGRVMVEETGIRKTPSHGDLWSNNMLFKLENGIAKHCILLDYQVSRYFYPSFDVQLFLYANTDPEKHAAEHPHLLQYYYDTLGQIFAEHGLHIADIYPEDDYKRSLKLVEYETKLQAYSVQAFVNLNKQTLNEAVQDDEDSFYKFISDDRVMLCLEAFQTDANYRKAMKNSMYALHDCLFYN